MRAHSASLDPSTGCATYARASSTDEIAYRIDVALIPSPAICGNTNHIQWPCFRPPRSSATAVHTFPVRPVRGEPLEAVWVVAHFPERSISSMR